MDSKKRTVIFSIFAVILMLSVISIYTQHGGGQNTEKITAMDGKSTADKIAIEWNNSATLVGGGLCGEIDNEGKATCWTFAYQNNMNGNGTYEFNVKVYGNGETKTWILWLNAPTSTHKIEGWTIDSDEAYSIAMKNEKIKAFLHKYPDAEVDSFSLHSSGNSSHPVWKIEWVDWGFLDNPHWAEIQIDATTGNVLYVNADLTGSSISAQDVCIGFSIVFIAVIAVLVFKKRGKSRKENPDKEERGYERDERYER